MGLVDGVNEWSPIIYRDFWDFPRMFLVEREDGVVLFDCAFDDAIEDYCDEYEVYLLPSITEEELAGSWHDLPAKAACHLGSIPAKGMIFNQSRREAVLKLWLDTVLRALERQSQFEP